MKTIKILNNSIYTIKFYVIYNNKSISSNFIISTSSSSLTIDDSAKNIEIKISLIDSFKQLVPVTSIKLDSAKDKYYEFIGSTSTSNLIELNDYSKIENPYYISLINKTSTHKLKVDVLLGMNINYTPLGFKEESPILKNNEYFSYPIPINPFLSLEFIIYVTSKSSPQSSDFKKIDHLLIKDSSLKYCYEFSRKGFTTGLYKSKNCYKNSSNMIVPN